MASLCLLGLPVQGMLVAVFAVLFQLHPFVMGALIFFGGIVALLTNGASQSHCDTHPFGLLSICLSVSLSKSKDASRSVFGQTKNACNHMPTHILYHSEGKDVNFAPSHIRIKRNTSASK
jgi:hypothetical protein